MTQRQIRILRRWKSLEASDTLRLITIASRFLWGLLIALCGAVIIGVMYGLHPIGIALVSVFVGFMIPVNIGKQRLETSWPIIRKYIDWHKVQQDLDAAGIERQIA